MLKVQRLEQIQEELQKHGVLSIEALAEALHVSQSTIRRDLFELEEQGEVLKRIRGGAVKYLTCFGISKSRQRFLIPNAFIAGVMARQIVFSVRCGSATTRFTVIGSRPRATHSTDA